MKCSWPRLLQRCAEWPTSNIHMCPSNYSNKTLRAFLYLPVQKFLTGPVVPAAEDDPMARCSLHVLQRLSENGPSKSRDQEQDLASSLAQAVSQIQRAPSLTEPIRRRKCPRRSHVLVLALFTLLGLTLFWVLCTGPFKIFWDNLTMVDLPTTEV